MMTDCPPVRLALTYADKGIPVFPIAISWDTEKRKTNKRPLTTNGFRDATTDPATVTRMFDRHVNSGAILAVGLHPGPAGYVIVDLDVNERVDGYACWQDLCQLYGDPGDVPTVLTASGGRHLWFRKPAGVDYGNAHDLGEGIDVRADDGYVVAPGTVTPWGVWEWDGDDIHAAPAPEVPAWTRQRLHTSTGTGAPAERNVDLDSIEDPADRAAIEALMRLGGHGLYKRPTARRDGTVVTCYYLTRPGKIAGTSVSVGFVGPGVARVFSPNWPGLSERAYDADELYQIAGITPPAQEPAESKAEDPPAPKLRLLSVADVLSLPPPVPMVGDWLDVGMLAEMPGQYGSLKSFAAMSMCLSIASGLPWLGEEIHATGPVIYASLEGVYTLGPRYAGWLEEHGLDDVPDLFTWGERLNILDERQLGEFGGLLAEVKPLLTVIDTVSKATPGAEENGSEFSSAVYTAMAHFRDCSGGAVLAVHHSGYGAAGRGRGHSGLEQDIDVVLSFTGQWKDGPVLMKSEKQKARENPPQKWVGLETSASGHPVLTVVAERPKEGAADLKVEVLAMVERYPLELTKKDLYCTTSRGYVGPQKAVVDAVGQLVVQGRIEYRKHRREGDRQVVDCLISTRSDR